jgi:NTE family protein
MIDGGVFNPVPFEYLLDKADIVVGIDVVGWPAGDPELIPTRIDSLFGASQLMMQSIIAMKLKAHQPHVFLAPEVGRFKVLDFMKAAEVLEISSSLKDDVKRALDAEITRRIAAE